MTNYFHLQNILEQMALRKDSTTEGGKYSSRSLQFYSLKGEASYRDPEQRVKGLFSAIRFRTFENTNQFVHQVYWRSYQVRKIQYWKCVCGERSWISAGKV